MLLPGAGQNVVGLHFPVATAGSASEPHSATAPKLAEMHWLCADDTIISWTDPEIGTDIALSFQVGSRRRWPLHCCRLAGAVPALGLLRCRSRLWHSARLAATQHSLPAPHAYSPALPPLQEARGCNYIWEQVLHVQESSSPPHDDGSPGAGIDGALFGPRRLGGGGLDDFDPAGPAGRYDGEGKVSLPGQETWVGCSRHRCAAA